MSKTDKLLGRFGGNIAAAVTRPEGGMSSTPPAPHIAVPDKYAGAVRSRAFAELPLDAIDRDATQPRTEFDEEELSRLTASIKRFGQLAPIRVRPNAEAPGRWVVLVGERRWRACGLAGLEKIRVEFVEREMTEADVLAEQIVENAVRHDLRPVDQAAAFKRLTEVNGWTAQELAENLGIEPTTVYRSLGLLRLDESVAEAVNQGAIKPTAAYEISKLQIADEQREVAELAVSGGLDHPAVAAEVKRRREAAKAPSKGRGAKAKPTVGPKTFRTPFGKVTVEPKRGAGPGAILETLRAAVEAEMGQGAEAA
jgi:ParB family transcriptional regulator, chromosome partitioning protein